MKTVGIITNTDRDPALVFTKEVIGWLAQRGCGVLITEEIADKLPTAQNEDAFRGQVLVANQQEMYTRPEFLTVLGGDGTILRVSEPAALGSIPLLGINLGNMGYLADVEKSGAFYALEQVLAGNYKLEKRMMLEAEILEGESSARIVGSGASGQNHGHRFALNDACISRGISTTMIDLALWINDEYIHTYRGDGIIVATPTGSTAYNLSAGGPILKPDVEMLAITPICAHMLLNHSFVVSGSDQIKIKVAGHSYNEGLLVMDGYSRFPLKNGDEILLCRSSFHTTIMKTNPLGFYDILRQKMKA